MKKEKGKSTFCIAIRSIITTWIGLWAGGLSGTIRTRPDHAIAIEREGAVEFVNKRAT